MLNRNLTASERLMYVVSFQHVPPEVVGMLMLDTEVTMAVRTEANSFIALRDVALR